MNSIDNNYALEELQKMRGTLLRLDKEGKLAQIAEAAAKEANSVSALYMQELHEKGLSVLYLNR